MTIEISNCDDTIFNKILNDELLFYRNNYTKLSKVTISEKSKIKEKKRKIEEMKKEIEHAKNPQTSKAKNNFSENDLNIKNLELNLNSTKNNDPSNEKKVQYEQKKSIKSDIIGYKSEDNNILGKLNASSDLFSIANQEETVIKLLEELKDSKDNVNKITDEIYNIKKLNSKIENEISGMNNELSSKFCNIYKLEKKLDRLKNKKHTDVNEGFQGDKIQKKISMPISTKLRLNNTLK